MANCSDHSIRHYYERKDEMKQQEKELQPTKKEEFKADATDILEEIEVEDLTVDGICGVY
jgi:mycofactocin precursor